MCTRNPSQRRRCRAPRCSNAPGPIRFCSVKTAQPGCTVYGPARAEHDRIIDEAETLGVFGVPTMVFNGELFWGGDRIDMLTERIKDPDFGRGCARQQAPQIKQST